MKSYLKLALICSVALARTRAIQAQEQPEGRLPVVTVRLYNYAQVDPTTLNRAIMSSRFSSGISTPMNSGTFHPINGSTPSEKFMLSEPMQGYWPKRIFLCTATLEKKGAMSSLSGGLSHVACMRLTVAFTP